MTKTVSFNGQIFKSNINGIFSRAFINATKDSGEEAKEVAIKDYREKRITNDPPESAQIIPGFGTEDKIGKKYTYTIFTTPVYAKYVNDGWKSGVASFSGHHFMEEAEKSILKTLPGNIKANLNKI